MSAQPKDVVAVRHQPKDEWSRPGDAIVIGKDILELLSSSMYIDPMTIYREYVQNAADAIDQAQVQHGRVTIQIDTNERRIVIRDNGCGVPAEDFVSRLMNLGASLKRGTCARGFRGVGRLAGLGYCQELIFRSRAKGDAMVSEMRWDCRRLRSLLRGTQDADVLSVLRDVVSVRSLKELKAEPHYFEVELKGVVRQGNDKLLNPIAVGGYLAQVAPVPFAPDFKFGAEISDALRTNGISGALDIRINGASEPLYRPYRDTMEGEGFDSIRLSALELHELRGLDGELAAICWIAHHEYAGALPSGYLIKGLRARSGDIQVGELSLFEDLFPEVRFNSWTVGEVHFMDRKVVPNGRRDHFEQGAHYENVTNQLAPIVKDIARRCRQSSIARKWIRTFDLHAQVAIDRAKIVARGGISKATIQMHSDAASKATKAMRKVVTQRLLSNELRSELAKKAEHVGVRVAKLLKGVEVERDPLKHFKPQMRKAYEDVISLLYECVGNRSAAGIIVEKILNRLETKGLEDTVAAQKIARSAKKARKSR